MLFLVCNEVRTDSDMEYWKYNMNKFSEKCTLCSNPENAIGWSSHPKRKGFWNILLMGRLPKLCEVNYYRHWLSYITFNICPYHGNMLRDTTKGKVKQIWQSNFVCCEILKELKFLDCTKIYPKRRNFTTIETCNQFELWFPFFPIPWKSSWFNALKLCSSHVYCQKSTKYSILSCEVKSRQFQSLVKSVTMILALKTRVYQPISICGSFQTWLK